MTTQVLSKQLPKLGEKCFYVDEDGNEYSEENSLFLDENGVLSELHHFVEYGYDIELEDEDLSYLDCVYGLHCDDDETLWVLGNFIFKQTSKRLWVTACSLPRPIILSALSPILIWYPDHVVLNKFIDKLAYDIRQHEYLKYRKNDVVLYKGRQTYDENKNPINMLSQKVKIIKQMRHFTVGDISAEYVIELEDRSTLKVHEAYLRDEDFKENDNDLFVTSYKEILYKEAIKALSLKKFKYLKDCELQPLPHFLDEKHFFFGKREEYCQHYDKLDNDEVVSIIYELCVNKFKHVASHLLSKLKPTLNGVQKTVLSSNSMNGMLTTALELSVMSKKLDEGSKYWYLEGTFWFEFFDIESLTNFCGLTEEDLKKKKKNALVEVVVNSRQPLTIKYEKDTSRLYIQKYDYLTQIV